MDLGLSICGVIAAAAQQTGFGRIKINPCLQGESYYRCDAICRQSKAVRFVASLQHAWENQISVLCLRRRVE
jgi:hypothetical protein